LLGAHIEWQQIIISVLLSTDGEYVVIYYALSKRR